MHAYICLYVKYYLYIAYILSILYIVYKLLCIYYIFFHTMYRENYTLTSFSIYVCVCVFVKDILFLSVWKSRNKPAEETTWIQSTYYWHMEGIHTLELINGDYKWSRYFNIIQTLNNSEDIFSILLQGYSLKLKKKKQKKAIQMNTIFKYKLTVSSKNTTEDNKPQMILFIKKTIKTLNVIPTFTPQFPNQE